MSRPPAGGYISLKICYKFTTVVNNLLQSAILESFFQVLYHFLFWEMKSSDRCEKGKVMVFVLPLLIYLDDPIEKVIY